ncbi:MAG TPA: transposase, partial [Chitinophagales bacterium]|nr:transposase [Chitinophagales bacterium]
RRRAAIEPVIGHLKQDYRMARNFLKGIKGDAINVLLSAAGMNFKRMINHWKKAAHFFAEYFSRLIMIIRSTLSPFLFLLNLKITF